MIQAGGANTWTAKPNATYDKCEIVLEGNSADWLLRTNASTSTYTNKATNTSVTIPASRQKLISYA